MRYPIRRRWIWSIILIVVVILFIVLIFNSVSIDVLDDEILNAHKTATDFLHQGVDKRLLELEHVSIQLELDNRNLSLRHSTNKDDFTSARTYEFTELFKNARLANEFIEDIFIYYPAADYVVGSRGSFTSRGYYLLGNHLVDTHYEEWIASIVDEKDDNFIVKIGTDSRPELYYRHKALPTGDSKNDAILIAQISREATLRVANLAVSNQPHTMLTILDDTGQVYASCGDTGLENAMGDLENRNFAVTANPRSFEAGGYAAMAAQSEHTGLYYIVVSNTNAILEVPRRLSFFSYLMILACLLLGVILSIIVSRRQNQPLEKLAVRLNASPENPQSLDYASIEKQVDSILRENHETIQRNIDQSWILKDRFLNEIIMTMQEDSGTICSMAAFFGISFDYIYFQLVLLHPMSGDDTPPEALLRDAMRKMAEELEQRIDILTIPAIINGNMAILLNYESPGGSDAARLCEGLKALLGGRVSATIGEEFESDSQIVFSYEKALNELDLSVTGSGLGKIGGFAPVHKEWSEGKALHARWLKSLRLKEYGQAAEMCGLLFSQYVFADSDQYTSRGRKYTVINDLLECTDEENLHHGTLSRKKASQQLQACKDSGQLLECVKRLLGKLESTNDNYAESQQDSLPAKIKKIIDENYAQAYLGLYYIADIVKVSTSYISKLFKKEYSIGITEYINYLRIVRAKELIGEGNMNIKEVATQVGFNSDIHFIRVFKKYESTTPGAYRKTDK